MTKAILRFIPLLLSAILSTSSFAGSAHELIPLFQKRFFENYVSARCGDNIRGLLDEAHVRGLDLSSAELIVITNQGPSVMGLVNAELARSEDGSKPGEQNWYHHVILAFDGLVFDFDFTNDPTPLPVAPYFEKMFLEEMRDRDRPWARVGRKRKLAEYKLQIFSGTEYYASQAARRAPTESRVVSLGEYLGGNPSSPSP